MLNLITYYVTFGKIHFVLFFVYLLFLYLAWKALTLATDCFIFGKRDRLPALKNLIRISAIFASSFIIFFLLTGVSLEYIATAHPAEAIAATNDRLMAVDLSIFDIYPFAWLQTAGSSQKNFFDDLANTLIGVYSSLAFAFGAILFVALIKNARLFYRFAVGFGASFLISLPIWYLIPAVPPLDGYIDNVTGAPLSADVRLALARYEPNPALAETLDGFRMLRDRYLAADAEAITTMPSMHVAWATLILYFGISAWMPLATILIPYFILNLVSTVYVAQHYAVDAIGGIVVALAAIALSNIIARRGTPKIIADLHSLIRNDIRGGFTFLRHAFSPEPRNL